MTDQQGTYVIFPLPVLVEKILSSLFSGSLKEVRDRSQPTTTEKPTHFRGASLSRVERLEALNWACLATDLASCFTDDERLWNDAVGAAARCRWCVLYHQEATGDGEGLAGGKVPIGASGLPGTDCSPPSIGVVSAAAEPAAESAAEAAAEPAAEPAAKRASDKAARVRILPPPLLVCVDRGVGAALPSPDN